MVRKRDLSEIPLDKIFEVASNPRKLDSNRREILAKLLKEEEIEELEELEEEEPEDYDE